MEGGGGEAVQHRPKATFAADATGAGVGAGASGATGVDRIGEYVLGRELGRGSFAKVYLGVHEETKGMVAIKKIVRSRLSPKLLQNLESEISILRNFQHANIVSLHGIKKTRQHIFLVLEYCAGGDLHKFIKSRKKLSEPVARHFMLDLAAGLEFLWSRQLIHRDIKPQNLLLTAEEETATLKIADFGFARHLGAEALADTLCGSPLYMAPEILSYQKYDAKADLWSAGTVLFEMLAGTPPYGGANQHELLENIRRKELRLPRGVSISPECVALIQMLLQRKPAARASFEKFLAADFLRPEPPPDADYQGSPRRMSLATAMGAPPRTAPPHTKVHHTAAPAPISTTSSPTETTSVHTPTSTSTRARPSNDQAGGSSAAPYAPAVSAGLDTPRDPMMEVTPTALAVPNVPVATPPPPAPASHSKLSKPSSMSSSPTVSASSSSPPFAVQAPRGGGLAITPPLQPWSGGGVQAPQVSVPVTGSGGALMLSSPYDYSGGSGGGGGGGTGTQFPFNPHHHHPYTPAVGIPGAIPSVSPPSSAYSPATSIRQPMTNPFKPLTASPPGASAFAAYAAAMTQHHHQKGYALHGPATTPNFQTHPHALQQQQPPSTLVGVSSGSRLDKLDTSGSIGTGMGSDDWCVVDGIGSSGSAEALVATSPQGAAATPPFGPTPTGPTASHNSPYVTNTTAIPSTAPTPVPSASLTTSQAVHMVQHQELLGRCAMGIARVADSIAVAVLSSARKASSSSSSASSVVVSSSTSMPTSSSPASSSGGRGAGRGGGAEATGAGLYTASASSGADDLPFATGAPPTAMVGVGGLEPAVLGDGGDGGGGRAAGGGLGRRAVGGGGGSGHGSPTPTSPSGLGPAQLSEALVLYLKAMNLVRRAVELGRAVLNELPGVHPQSATPLSSSSAQLVGQVASRANQLVQWLSSQFALLLERAEQCRLSSPPGIGSGVGSALGGGGGGGGVQAEEVIYVSAMQLARSAAVKELLGQSAQSLKMYQQGQLLIEALLLEPNLTEQDRHVLSGYDRGFEDRITEISKSMA